LIVRDPAWRHAIMSLRRFHYLGLLALPLLVGCGASYKNASATPASYAPPSPPPVYGGMTTNGVPGAYAARPGAAPAPVSRATADREEVVMAESTSADGDSGGSVSDKKPSEPTPLPPPTSRPDVGTEPDATNVATNPTAGNANGGTQQPTQAKEMLDIEANMTVAVDSVRDSAAKIRQIARDHGANITGDQVQDEGAYQRGAFEIRVPSDKIDAFLEAISGIGTVRSRDVRATDVSKQYFDSQILLRNLEVTMKRYEEILAQAKNVQEVLVVEQELTRLRGEINRVKGELRFMRDRVSRSTVHLQIVPKSVDTTPPPEVPEAKLFPGVRGTMLADFTGDGHTSYYGLGVSIFALRAFQIDVDVMRHGSSLFGKGSDQRAFLVTMGGDIYSDFFGGGRRMFLNPYIGLRAGYARIDGKNDALIAGTVGLELLRTKGVLIDLQARLHLFFGNSDGAHAGIQPTLGVNFAF
jgi:hypothetical protein